MLVGLPREDWIKQVVQNNRVYSVWIYPKEDGGASAIYFDNGIVYHTNWNAAAPPASQASGLVGRSSAPSHLPAAFAAPAANDKANIAAAVVVNKLVFIFDSSLDAAISGVGPPKAPCSVAATEGTCDQHRKNERDANDDDCRVPLDARQRQPVLEELDHREADHGAPDGA